MDFSFQLEGDGVSFSLLFPLIWKEDLDGLADFDGIRAGGICTQEEGADMRPLVKFDHTPTIGIIAAIPLSLIIGRSYPDHAIREDLSPARELKPLHFIRKTLPAKRPGGREECPTLLTSRAHQFLIIQKPVEGSRSELFLFHEDHLPPFKDVYGDSAA